MMKKICIYALISLVILGMVSCASTAPAETEVSAVSEAPSQSQEGTSDQTVALPGPHWSGEGSVPGSGSSLPTADTFHTDYIDFEGKQVIVSVPNNVDQDIEAIIWLCDESVANTSVIDLGTYPTEYKEKYIVAIVPHEFDDTVNIRMKDMLEDFSGAIDLIKVLAEEHDIILSKIVVISYTLGHFSVAFQ
jgi:hypothetical protein